MQKENVVFEASIGGGNKVQGYFYPTEEAQPKGVIQICHGMAEYIGRYEEMIAFLNECGWHVCGMDMLGHGGTYALNKDNDMPLGYFGEDKGAIFKTIGDVLKMHNKAKERFGADLTYVLYGHSMGSFVARAVYSLPKYSGEFDAYVISSTMGPNPAVGFAKFLASMASKKKPANLVNAAAFGSYNKRVKNRLTVFDWISTDPEEVADYMRDDMLGFTFTGKGFYDLFTLVEFIQSSEAYNNLALAPIFFTYGDDDPVGSYGEGVRKVIKAMEEKGAPVKSKDYGPYRHEIQHEPVRAEYFKDIDDFFTQAL
ncbi:Lysophospholipase, alpha-beta hydrolase superfamily [Ruminococcaceae bacterium YRB3002]|nr:Lysophospholipase, alpha-beta hydrolase superfamily [Ruminococcaceae bacterium YRB3002]